jgi:hypothetical protein
MAKRAKRFAELFAEFAAMDGQKSEAEADRQK